MEEENKPRPKRWSVAAEEKLKKEFYHIQRLACDDVLKAYTKCAKEEGFKVILNCREKLEVANNCLHERTSNEQYAEFREKKIDAWVEQGVLIRPPK